MATRHRPPSRPPLAERIVAAVHLPRRAVWVLSFGVAGLLLAALIVFVVHAQRTANAPAAPPSKQALETELSEDRIVVEQDEAPHVVRLLRHETPAVAAKAAVLHYMKRQIGQGTIDGPVERSACRLAAGSIAARQAYTCTVTAANVNYPFDAVVVPKTRVVTYCKYDLPPIPSMKIPVSSRCRAGV